MAASYRKGSFLFALFLNIHRYSTKKANQLKSWDAKLRACKMAAGYRKEYHHEKVICFFSHLFIII